MKFLRLLFFSFLIIALPVVASAAGPAAPAASVWTVDYIPKVPPIMIRDALIEILGQSKAPLAFTYEEAVKLSGHNCMITAATWGMLRLALAELYPNEVPVRGQIQIQAPGAADEWHLGPFAQIMSYVTGAAPITGFNGSGFGEGNKDIVRINKMIFTKEPSGLPPPMMEWVFTRIDTGKKVGIKFDARMVKPPLNEEALKPMMKKLALGTATPEEIAKFNDTWNLAAKYMLENAGKVPGLISVRVMPSY